MRSIVQRSGRESGLEGADGNPNVSTSPGTPPSACLWIEEMGETGGWASHPVSDLGGTLTRSRLSCAWLVPGAPLGAPGKPHGGPFH